MLRVGHRVMMIRALGGCLAGGVVAGGVVLGMNASHHDQNSALSLSGNGAAAQAAAQGQITCPDVASKLPAIPAQAQAEVDRNLALLDTQIAEANKRLVTSVGQGGPNFVQNAILGPLKDKRVSTIDRIAISIGRRAQKPTGLDSLAACSLSGAAGGGAAASPSTAPPAGAGAGAGTGAASGAAGPGTISCPDVAGKLPAIPAQAQAEVDRNLALLQTQIAEANKRLVDTVGQGGPNFVQNAILGPLKSKRVATIDRIAISIGRRAQKPTGLDSLAACTLNKGAAGGGAAAGGAKGGNQGGAKGGNQAGNQAGNQGGNAGANTRAGKIVCPDVASKLPAVPARAQAEVSRNLALLQTQIAEANKRLVDTVGQGGPNFVQNAILGPLKDKRVATIDRIAISIGRQGTKPQGLGSLAPCRLQ